MPTHNQQLFDAALRHQIFLIRYAGGLRNRVNEILDKSEEVITDKIKSRLPDDITTRSNWKRLLEQQQVIRALRKESWDDAKTTILADAEELATKEAEFYTAMMVNHSPVILDTVTPSSSAMKSLILTRPFEGKLLKEWLQHMETADLDRVQNVIQDGVQQGLGARTISRNVFGTQLLRKRDGITQVTRSNVDAIVRTAILHISNTARAEVAALNASIIKEEIYVATLDSRTTTTCKGFDGQIFEVGKGPHPPVHVGCRSARAMIFNTDIGVRPANPTTEKMLIGEYSKNNKLGSIVDRESLPFGHKTRYDGYARKRIRALVGPIPKKVTYNDWLRTQSVDFQNETLGKTRARLYRVGGLTLDKFIDVSGRPLTLQELYQQDKLAFTKAGIKLNN